MRGEYVDLYDSNKKLIGQTIFREKGKKVLPPEGLYTIVVLALIKDSQGNYLVQKTSARKNGVWALPGGHVKSGQTSIEAIQEEICEEMGITIALSEIKLWKTYKYSNAFKDVYIINKDIDLSTLKLEVDEVEKVLYLSKDEIKKLALIELIRKTNIDVINDILN